MVTVLEYFSDNCTAMVCPTYQATVPPFSRITSCAGNSSNNRQFSPLTMNPNHPSIRLSTNTTVLVCYSENLNHWNIWMAVIIRNLNQELNSGQVRCSNHHLKNSAKVVESWDIPRKRLLPYQCLVLSVWFSNCIQNDVTAQRLGLILYVHSVMCYKDLRATINKNEIDTRTRKKLSTTPKVCYSGHQSCNLWPE